MFVQLHRKELRILQILIILHIIWAARQCDWCRCLKKTLQKNGQQSLYTNLIFLREDFIGMRLPNAACTCCGKMAICAYYQNIQTNAINSSRDLVDPDEFNPEYQTY